METTTEHLRSELENALKAMAKISNQMSCSTNPGALFAALERDKSQLLRDNEFLRSELRGMERKNTQNGQDLDEIREISSRLQNEVLAMDTEKLRLSALVQEGREENEVLSKVMQKISSDYEELQRRHNDHQTEALRNMALALENENELLIKERYNLEHEVRALKGQIKEEQDLEESNDDLKKELAAKDEERGVFMDRFERLELEKINVLRQLLHVEEELEASKDTIDRMDLEASEMKVAAANTDEILQALRDGKRVVEQKLQHVLAQNSGLDEKVTLAETKAFSMEEALSVLEHDRLVGQSEYHGLEQQVAELTTVYESRIDAMQNELSLRLEELDGNRQEELNHVKHRYIQLFDEKAEELHKAKELLKEKSKELDQAKLHIGDLEYREVELQDLLSKARAQMDDKYQEVSDEVHHEITTLKLYNVEVETELDRMRGQYEELQNSYRNSVEALSSRLIEISDILREHREQTELDGLENLLPLAPTSKSPEVTEPAEDISTRTKTASGNTGRKKIKRKHKKAQKS